MSFFGGGGGGVQRKTVTYTVLPADTPGKIVVGPLEFDSINFNAIVDALAAYDGGFDIEVLLTDGSWNALVNNRAQALCINSELVGNGFGASLSDFTNAFPAIMNAIPRQIRFKIATQSTQGTCKIDVSYL